jgi:hypothetical protein
MPNNNLTKQNGGGALSNDLVNRLIAGIGKSRASVPVVGGMPLLRLLKSGNWVYGQNDDPVQDGSEWAINPLSMQHGWSCWTNRPGKEVNELLGEDMAPVTEDMPPRPDALQGFEWNIQRQMSLKCLNGDDEGIECVYKNSSKGGIRAVDTLLGLLTEQLRTDPSKVVPIVRLDVSWYDHPKFGQTFVPIFEVVDWADMSGMRDTVDPVADEYGDEDEIDTTPAPAPVAKKAKPSLRPPVEPEPAPAPTRASAPPRRQRPVTRA